MAQFRQILTESQDNKYFHLTCHVKPSLCEKIENGQFVKLDRLLPKTRSQIMNDEQQMQFVNCNGVTFWIPADNNNKVTGIKKWDQAFCIYAAIYCRANPSRSAEIWQYIHIIHMALTSYAWENVAYYDYTFRQMMNEQPGRSWVKTYNQLWNLAMCKPINKYTHHNNSFAGQSNLGSNKHESSGTSWHDRCWQFNHGAKCKKWNCHYDHRCENCGSWSHNATNCPKKTDDGGCRSSKSKCEGGYSHRSTHK